MEQGSRFTTRLPIPSVLWILLLAGPAGLWLADRSAGQESERPPLHRVAGRRDGRSFFPRVDYPEVRPLEKGKLDFRHYHTYDEMLELLRARASRHPDLVELYSAGRSFEGREIWQVTLTNRKTGKHTDKPAMYIEGGRHSGEIASSESVLWLLDHVLERYGADGEITRLLDTKTLYLRVTNNPDGGELYRLTAQANRSTVRPWDEDGDGLVDEDAGEDLDGDGYIRQMRRSVGKGGNAIVDTRDPSGRLMKSVPDGEGDWLVYLEGVDDDLDGKYNEDGIGGIDLHRNYPENWRPAPGRDATGRGFTQIGAGEFPLSEPETRSVVLFLLSHPNVSIVESMDTPLPMHMRPPSTSKSEERMFEEDLRWYRYFDRKGVEITRYPYAGDAYHDYRTRLPVDELTGEPSRPRAMFGHGLDFGYFYYGAIWYGDEIWNSGRMRDYNGDGVLDTYDAFAWTQRDRRGREFMDWKPFAHPQLGAVEIGGFNPKWAVENPPVDLLEEWARNQALFNLLLARHLPQVEIVDAAVSRVEPGLYRVSVTATNTGKLPTALEQARLVKIVKPDAARIELDERLVSEKRISVVEPALRDKSIELGWLNEGERKTATWTIRLDGIDSIRATVSVLSTRGGVARREIEVGR